MPIAMWNIRTMHRIKTDKCIQKQRCDCFVFVCGFPGGWLRHPKFARVGPQPRSLLCSQSSVEGTGEGKCALGTQLGNGKWEFARMILPTDAPQMTEMWMNRSMILYTHGCIQLQPGFLRPFRCLKLAYSGIANLRTLHSRIHCQGDPWLGQLDTKDVWLQVGVQHSTFSGASSIICFLMAKTI